MFRYVDRPVLLDKLSRLAREELRHFEQVMKLMRRRGIAYRHLTPARYAGRLRAHVRTHEPGRLVDLLVVGAFIEARSCERFEALGPHLDEELSAFYRGLCASESRHFRAYLNLASEAGSVEEVAERVAMFAGVEAELVSEPDTEFRFHSGPPTA
jgi:tRNA-(ms[2]io[6]A)-hydroxylase